MPDEPQSQQTPPAPSTDPAWRPGGGKWEGGGEGGPTQAPAPVAPAPQGFTHPALMGRTPQEIESMMLHMDRQLQEERARQAPTSAPAPVAPQTPPPDPYTQPEQYGDWVANRAASAVQSRMEPMLAPLNQWSARTAVDDAVANFSNHPQYGQGFAPYANTVKGMLRGVPANQLTEQSVLSAYLMAVGMGTLNQPPQQGNYQAPPGPQNYQGNYGAPPVLSPQHQPSPPPMPAQSGVDFEPLNENEKVIARKNGMTDGQYRIWQRVNTPEAIDLISRERADNIPRPPVSSGGMVAGVIR